ncbi:pyruvate, water dikinase regulatory protein [Lactiplantibacillus fabifermentans]|uniref:Putative pyruvate, phosphate dikinase regulatory protein n=2 Tax=Lactiplantibacillus fabifermentans TaxID=483011 RepID=A0A0R2NQZ1_9LACO|nr:pyruvate, water dikinase regulatory protein [Lactiplantibacillus fabifermentans]ETY74149.1 phosphotransferase [Lactiplantibacillus fabifermentans T30PCM01]KRO28129.1 phosphotransferase [Lactiplantibacillus fabifermentans DSM 21115]
MSEIKVFILSDSVGETAHSVAEAAAAQFSEYKINYQRFPFVRTSSLLETVLAQAEKAGAAIFFTFVDRQLSVQAHDYCEKHQLMYYDVLTPALDTFSQLTHVTPANRPGTVHALNNNYFDRINAIEFAVTYDDGKNPSGFLEADVVLLGVSRTSKTPLSLYLANRNLKVANLPLVPQAQIPDEIWKVDPKKVFGLTNDPEKLNDIRRQRMVQYGLNPDTVYSNTDKIRAELDYADNIFKKIGCLVINVANKSIEETATLITESLGSNAEN